MADEIPVPTLSTKGWITSTSEKADFIVTHLFLTNKSQSYIYGQNTFSPQKVYQEHINNLPMLIEVLRYGFETVLSRYFDLVTVSISEKLGTANTSRDGIELFMRCDIVHKGKEYQLGKLIGGDGSMFRILTNVINEGIAP